MMKRTILLSLAALCCALTAAAQDLIVKTDAAKIEAKVIEITPEAVRYKRFSNPDGPTYVPPLRRSITSSMPTAKRSITPKPFPRRR